MAIAFFSTWTTYGTWLPGDERGWFHAGRLREVDSPKRFAAALSMNDGAVWLDDDERRLVEHTIADHCAIRRWTLHAVNCRTNHVHFVVTAPGAKLDVPREQFKAWCTRKLKERSVVVRDNWWTQRGWDEYVDDDKHLENAILYVRHQ